MIRALLLDLDDTLFDRGAAFEQWALAHIPGVTRAQLVQLAELDERGRRDRADFAAAVLALTGLAIDAAAFPQQLARHVVPEPGAREALARLARGRRVAVVTNGGAAQRDKLARAGVADLVAAVFVSSELGVAKPDARIFDSALRWTEVRAEDCLFVGDDPVVDLAPAAALGMPTAWRVRGTWPRELARPTHTVQALAELEALL